MEFLFYEGDVSAGGVGVLQAALAGDPDLPLIWVAHPPEAELPGAWRTGINPVPTKAHDDVGTAFRLSGF